MLRGHGGDGKQEVWWPARRQMAGKQLQSSVPDSRPEFGTEYIFQMPPLQRRWEY